MNEYWKALTTEDQMEELIRQSHTKPQVIFKHSTRCSISHMVKARLENAPKPENIEFHYLDLLTYRALSDKIADSLLVQHESPQVLLIKDGHCIFNESHMVIRMQDIEEAVA